MILWFFIFLFHFFISFFYFIFLFHFFILKATMTPSVYLERQPDIGFAVPQSSTPYDNLLSPTSKPMFMETSSRIERYFF